MQYNDLQLHLLSQILKENKNINTLVKNFQPKYLNAFDEKFFQIIRVLYTYIKRNELVNYNNLFEVMTNYKDSEEQVVYGKLETNELIKKLININDLDIKLSIGELLIEIYNVYLIGLQDEMIKEMSKTKDVNLRKDIYYKYGLIMQGTGKKNYEFVDGELLSKTIKRVFEKRDKEYLHLYHLPELSRSIKDSLDLDDGSLISILANTGGGKTAFSLYLAGIEFTYNRLLRKRAGDNLELFKVAYISTEMQKEQFGKRLASMITGLSQDDLYKSSNLESLHKACEDIRELNLHTYFIRNELYDNNLYDLIKHAHSIDGCKIIVVDFFQAFRTRDTKEPKYSQLAFIMSRLAELARKLHIKIFVTMQMNREAEGKDFSQINKGNVSGSYDALQACDVVLLIGKTRLEDYKNNPKLGNRRIKVDKNRNGIESGVVFRCNMNDFNMRWETVQEAIDYGESILSKKDIEANPYNTKESAYDKMMNLPNKKEKYPEANNHLEYYLAEKTADSKEIVDKQEQHDDFSLPNVSFSWNG